MSAAAPEAAATIAPPETVAAPEDDRGRDATEPVEEFTMLEAPVTDAATRKSEPRSRSSTGGSGARSPRAATPAVAAGSAALYEESPPMPPSGESWDWPLSRHEKKSRLTMLDRLVLLADNRLLERQVQKLRARSPSCAGAEEAEGSDCESP